MQLRRRCLHCHVCDCVWRRICSIDPCHRACPRLPPQPAFERMRRWVASRFQMGPKASFICVVTLINVVGSFTYLFSGVGAVSLFLRVPVLP